MKISDDVMAVLSTMGTSGSEARISAQIDRKLYVKTNKVLEALGGKWNRKAKAHLFRGDAETLIESVLLTGEVTTAKDIGFFPTPLKIGRQLVELADLRDGLTVLEPSAGRGDLIEAIVEHHEVTVLAVEREQAFANEIRQRFSKSGGVTVYTDNFFSEELLTGIYVERVVMNPPFVREDGRDHLDHVRAAHALLKKDGRLISVLPKSVDFREDRRHRDFRGWVSEHNGRTLDLPEDAFAPSGTKVSTVALVMVAT